MAVEVPRDPREERLRLLSLELAGLQEALDEIVEAAPPSGTGKIREVRIRRAADRLRAARSRLYATIEEDRA